MTYTKQGLCKKIETLSLTSWNARPDHEQHKTHTLCSTFNAPKSAGYVVTQAGLLWDLDEGYKDPSGTFHLRDVNSRIFFTSSLILYMISPPGAIPALVPPTHLLALGSS